MIGEDDFRCTYEPGQRSPRTSTGTNAHSVSRDSAWRHQGIRFLPSKTSVDGLSFSERLARPSSDASLLACQNSSESASSLPPPPPLAPCERPLASPPRVHSEVVLHPPSDVLAAWNTRATAECVPRPTVSSFTILPSIHFRTIPRPLRVPLSLIPPERVQVSSVAEGDLDMTLYVLSRFLNSHRVVGAKPSYASRLRSLCQINKLGIYFGPEKQEALLRGDISNTVVNRYFVYSFRAIGTHLCEVLDQSPATVRLLARCVQKAWESFIEIYRGDDQRLAAQGMLLFLHSFVIMGFPSKVQFYLLKVCELINRGNLSLLPAYGRPPELSEQVREDAAVLSQVIYLENYVYLVFGGPAPVETAKIEREFRQNFQVRIIRCMV